MVVTPEQRKEEIERILATLSEEERKKVIFIQPSKKPKVEGVRQIDPATGKLGQSIFTVDFPKRKFIAIEDPTIVSSRRRMEEKRETAQLAQKEAEFEAKRIEEGKIKPKDVVLTQKGSKAILQKILKEKAEKEAQKQAKELGIPPSKIKGQTLNQLKQAIIEELEQEKELATARRRTAFKERIKKAKTAGEIISVFRESKEPTHEGLKAFAESKVEGEGVTRIISGRAIPTGFRPPVQSLLDIKLARKGIELPEELTLEQKFEIFKRDVTAESIFKGVIDIPVILGKDILTLAKGPAPFTPQFSVEVATDKELRESALRISAVGAVGAGLTLLPPLATVGAGLLFTGLETKRFIERPTGEQLGRTLFIGGISAFSAFKAIKSKIITVKGPEGKITVVKAPFEKAFGLETGKGFRGLVFTGGKIPPTSPPTPTTPALTTFDLTKVFTGKGLEAIGARFAIGTTAESVFVTKPSEITGLQPPSFVSKVRDFPSRVRKFIIETIPGKIPKKVSIELIEDGGKPISLGQALKETFALPKEKPIEVDVSKVTAEQLVTTEEIVEGKRVTTQRAITELKPITLGDILKEQFALPEGKLIEITKEGRFRDVLKETFALPKEKPIDIEFRKVISERPKALTEFTVLEETTLGDILKEQFALPEGKLIEITKEGRFRDVLKETFALPKEKPIDIEFRKVISERPKALTEFTVLEETTLGDILKEQFALPEGKLIEITKEGRFRDVLKETFALPKEKPIDIEFRKVISERPKALTEFTVLEETTLGDILKEQFALPEGKLIEITKEGRFRDLFEVSKEKPIGGIDIELIRGLDVPSELKQFAPGGVEIRKRADLGEAIRFLRQEEPPEFLTLRIPRARLDIIRKEVGEGIGFGEVTRREFRGRLLDISYTVFGPQRVITAREIEEPKLLEGPKEKVIKQIKVELKERGEKPVVTFDRRGVPIAPAGFRVIETEIPSALGRVQIQLALQELEQPELIAEQLIQPMGPEIKRGFGLPIIFPIREREKEITDLQAISELQIEDTRQIPRQIRIQKPKIGIDTELDIGLDIGRGLEREREPITIPDIGFKSRIITEQELELDIPEPPLEKPKEQVLPLPSLGLRKFIEPEEEDLFFVKAKSKGKFVALNKKALPRNKALNLGAEVVDNTASATFKLISAREKGKDVSDDLGFNLRGKFTKKNDTYVEKNKHRIDSMGEIEGITVKGWLAQRRKGLRI